MPPAGNLGGMTTPQVDPAHEPVNIKAVGPKNVDEPASVTRHFETNKAAGDAKDAESIKAQTAPNVTTDPDLAREAYGDDWQKRRGHKVIGHDSDGDKIFKHGQVAVDSEGHALGHADDPEAAAETKERLDEQAQEPYEKL